MDNADLLEKLDMIKEAVERNPEEWWREFITLNPFRDEWREFRSEDDFKDKIFSWKTALKFNKPQRVKVEGEVDAEVITWAQEIADTGRYNCPEHRAATALLQLVKEKGDGN